LLASWPWKVLVVLTLLQFALQENFPFSHYPMYSRFSDQTYLILITDEADNLIPVKAAFGLSADFLKRLYDTELRRHAREIGWTQKRWQAPDLHRPALRTLQQLAAHRGGTAGRAPYARLKLHQVTYSLRAASFQREQVLVAELSLC
jgi:hypothetical protein